jgi:hypothetical protein
MGTQVFFPQVPRDGPTIERASILVRESELRYSPWVLRVIRPRIDVAHRARQKRDESPQADSAVGVSSFSLECELQKDLEAAGNRRASFVDSHSCSRTTYGTGSGGGGNCTRTLALLELTDLRASFRQAVERTVCFAVGEACPRKDRSSSFEGSLSVPQACPTDTRGADLLLAFSAYACQAKFKVQLVIVERRSKAWTSAEMRPSREQK